MQEKRVLCYGDSNTWGFIPGGVGRLAADKRWTGVCQAELGKEYTVIECGLNGRTTVFDAAQFRNGADGLGYALLEQMPLDLVVLMLGTNDTAYADIDGVAAGVEKLVEMILTANEWAVGSQKVWPHDRPKVLLISPIYIHTDYPLIAGPSAKADRVEMSHMFAERFAQIAEKYGVDFLDAAQYAAPSHVDGIHIRPSDHPSLGRAVANKIRAIFAREE